SVQKIAGGDASANSRALGTCPRRFRKAPYGAVMAAVPASCVRTGIIIRVVIIPPGVWTPS
ncbi:hypothetical protein H8959_011667, partial [Pygathrix nigripes]